MCILSIYLLGNEMGISLTWALIGANYLGPVSHSALKN